MLAIVLYYLETAHDIAKTAPSCRTLCDAVRITFLARPFSSEVVKLVEAAQTKVYRQHYAPDDVRALAAEPKKLKAYQKKHAKFLQEFEKHAKPAIDGATFTQADADHVLEGYAAALALVRSDLDELDPVDAIWSGLVRI